MVGLRTLPRAARVSSTSLTRALRAPLKALAMSFAVTGPDCSASTARTASTCYGNAFGQGRFAAFLAFGATPTSISSWTAVAAALAS